MPSYVGSEPVRLQQDVDQRLTSAYVPAVSPYDEVPKWAQCAGLESTEVEVACFPAAGQISKKDLAKDTKDRARYKSI